MNTLYYITSELSELYTSMYYESGNQPPPQDPNAGANQPPPQDPNAGANQPPPQDPNAGVNQPPPQDPNAGVNQPPPQDPNAGVDDPKLDPMKKYLLLTKIIELKHYLELYVVSTELAYDTKNLIKFIGVVIDFYDIFDYLSLRSLSEDIMRESAKIVKHRDTTKRSIN